ncbi:MAG: riboflavin synthase [Acidiferrobacteraceae bacterium]
MFTGIVQAVGVISSYEGSAAGRTLAIDCPSWDAWRVAAGDSISVQGVCLTVKTLREEGFAADVSAETLRCTTFARLFPGQRVNLEPALALGDRLGGHLVSGHVDGVGTLSSMREEGDSRRLEFICPDGLRHYLAVKGSITIDGVSLTINECRGSRFSVNLVPHTLRSTTLGAIAPGDPVNLEVDLIARYLEALLCARGTPGPSVP